MTYMFNRSSIYTWKHFAVPAKCMGILI